jgi:protein O-mannosyl-transferase
MRGRLPEAIGEYRAGLRLAPEVAELHYSLGLALSQTPGRLPEAIQEYRTALRLKPDDADAHFSLGNALTMSPEGCLMRSPNSRRRC